MAFSPQANSTDWTTATGRSNLVPNSVDIELSVGPLGGTPMVGNLIFLDRSREFSFT
jgi:hypothetical protein